MSSFPWGDTSCRCQSLVNFIRTAKTPDGGHGGGTPRDSRNERYSFYVLYNYLCEFTARLP